MELLETTWYGASSEKLDELRQHAAALRTLAVAYEAQTRTGVSCRE
jgi:hypothetical protein